MHSIFVIFAEAIYVIYVPFYVISVSSLLNKLLCAEMHRPLFFKIMDRATCHMSALDLGLNNFLCTQGHDLTKLIA